jgi:hypothetical protein
MIKGLSSLASSEAAIARSHRVQEHNLATSLSVHCIKDEDKRVEGGVWTKEAVSNDEGGR